MSFKDEVVGGRTYWIPLQLLLSVFAFVLCSQSAHANNNEADAAGPVAGDWLIRGSVLRIRSLTQSTDIQAIGGSVESADRSLPGLDISYFITDHWALEFQGGRIARSYGVKGSTLGDFSVGRIDSDALTLAVQYHFRPSETIKPYVGLGVSHAWTRNVQPAQNIPDFDVKPLTSAMAVGGIDFAIRKNWVLNTSIKYFISPAYEFKGDNFSATVRINTLVLGTGVGFYF